jgi:hypothetical protein
LSGNDTTLKDLILNDAPHWLRRDEVVDSARDALQGGGEAGGSIIGKQEGVRL